MGVVLTVGTLFQIAVLALDRFLMNEPDASERIVGGVRVIVPTAKASTARSRLGK